MKKKFRSPLLIVFTLVLLTAIPAFSFAESVTWNDNFTQSQTPGLEQCQAWHGFLNQLDPELEFVSVTMSGTFAPEGIAITDPVAAQELASLLYSRTPGSVTSDGHTWYVGIGCNLASCVPSGEGVELRIDQADGCLCSSTAYTIRPDVGSSAWGGLKTENCSPPDQTMMVEFQIASSTSPATPSMSSTIMIGECDSGVDNFMLSDGYSVNDQIAECTADAKNHGSFVKCISQTLNSLKQEGLISGQEKGTIQKCAAKAKGLIK